MHLPTVLWPLSVAISIPKVPQVPLRPSQEFALSRPFDVTRLRVPGDSPAYYNGDSSEDILKIDTLDLAPRPVEDEAFLDLKGTILSSIGAYPRIKVTASLNGTVGPSIEDDLCVNKKLKIKQHGRPICPPSKGPVEMSYYVMIPLLWMKKGFYTVRTEIYATGGERVTDFEGTVWLDGEDQPMWPGH